MAVLVAPLVGVTDAESTVLHAVTREEIGRHADDWATLQSMRAACGTAVKLLSINGEAPTSWPMPTKYAPTMSRCPECRRVCGGRINRQWWGPSKPTRSAKPDSNNAINPRHGV